MEVRVQLGGDETGYSSFSSQWMDKGSRTAKMPYIILAGSVETQLSELLLLLPWKQDHSHSLPREQSHI